MGQSALLEGYTTILIISIISNIIAIIVAGIIASKKGFNTFGWVMLALVTGWIGVIIVACIKPQRRSYSSVRGPFYNSSNTPNLPKVFQCPHCGEQVRTNRCLYCGKENDFRFN